jgi:hypothetical protein
MRPSQAAIRALRRLGAEYLALDLVGCCPEYPSSWRVHALGEVESRPGPEVIVQLDSDALVLDDIGALCMGADACARPVDVKGMGTAGPGDEFEPYWAAVCALAGIELDALPFVRATVDGSRVRATYNGGFVAARRARGLFAEADALFRRSAAAGLRPHEGRGLNVLAGTGEVGVAGSEWWGSSQAVLSVTAARLGLSVEPLPDGVNVPVHMWDDLDPKPASVVHAHYHWLLGTPLSKPNALLDDSVPMPDGAAAWLRRRTPLPTRATGGGVIARLRRR